MSQRLPPRAIHFSDWYNEVINKAGLAENSSVRGCMVIKPYGFAIWEKIQSVLDQAFKERGHVNVYFPLLIPKSYFNKEAEHVAGFAKECAVVTHYRLKQIENEIIVDPDAMLEEELIVRPTSEAIIWNTYKNWIQSYRDLPILVNQWCNVVRWEMRPRLFLRNNEFLWQEGHTAHATCEEARTEAIQMIHLYERIAKDYIAMPLVVGTKTAYDKFAGADITYTLEALMQDGKVLQVGTSHFLGQQFSKAFGVTFTNHRGQRDYVWGTSWGVSTRLIGALIMMHADDDGLVLPPKIAPIQVIMIPVFQDATERDLIITHFNSIKEKLLSYGIIAKLDDQDTRKPGWKFAEYELKGIPIRMVLGPNDLLNNTIELVRRDNKEKIITSRDDLVSKTMNLLDEIQANIFQKALRQRDTNTMQVDRYDIFKEIIDTRGGLIMAHWDATTETEKNIQMDTKATIRCIPLNAIEEFGHCVYSGKPSTKRVVFAQAY